jgi:hypothetical protein
MTRGVGFTWTINGVVGKALSKSTNLSRQVSGTSDASKTQSELIGS